MSKRTLGLIIILLIVTVGLIILAILPKGDQDQQANQPQQGQQTQPANEERVPAHSVLALTPNPITMSSASGTIDVTLDTGENPVTAIQLELSYDPQAIRVVSINQGSFFANPFPLFDTIDPQNGRATYALGIAPGAEPQTGSGVVATIQFQAIPGATVQQTEITLLPKSLVTAKDVAASVLKEATGTTIILPQTATGTQTSTNGATTNQ